MLKIINNPLVAIDIASLLTRSCFTDYVNMRCAYVHVTVWVCVVCLWVVCVTVCECLTVWLCECVFEFVWDSVCVSVCVSEWVDLCMRVCECLCVLGWLCVTVSLCMCVTVTRSQLTVCMSLCACVSVYGPNSVCLTWVHKSLSVSLFVCIQRTPRSLQELYIKSPPRKLGSVDDVRCRYHALPGENC